MYLSIGSISFCWFSFFFKQMVSDMVWLTFQQHQETIFRRGSANQKGVEWQYELTCACVCFVLFYLLRLTFFHQNFNLLHRFKILLLTNLHGTLRKQMPTLLPAHIGQFLPTRNPDRRIPYIPLLPHTGLHRIGRRTQFVTHHGQAIKMGGGFRFGSHETKHIDRFLIKGCHRDFARVDIPPISSSGRCYPDPDTTATHHFEHLVHGGDILLGFRFLGGRIHIDMFFGMDAQ
mmetsp:Transcript_59610/g.71617  ORF Transcript_59610/g.71617 Transcript_59610/m.71617 type:complete len:232 (-) Transcript_59610:761-1456(-)